MKQKKCEYLDYPVVDPCRATDEQCPKGRLKRHVSMYCYKVGIAKVTQVKMDEER